MWIYPITMDSFSPISHHIDSLHDWAMVVVVSIVTLVMFMFLSFPSSFTRKVGSSEVLETIWTVLPCVVLACLAAPSLTVLYMSDEIVSPSISVKVVGHQWYWSYEFDDWELEGFSSYIVPSRDLWEGGLRLIEVDKRVPLPTSHEVRMVITSEDVIHSWTVPSLGVKVDAIPGRINQVGLSANRAGLVYGQCSEICGTNHSYMPICLELQPEEMFFHSSLFS